MGSDERPSDLGRRVSAALAVGLVSFGLSFVSAYVAHGPRLHDHAFATRSMLDRIERAIEDFREAEGHLPASLGEVAAIEELDMARLDDQGRAVDLWHHPIQYRVEGESFTLYSFGAEGEPGGRGMDADVFPGNSGRPLESPTFLQFAFNFASDSVWKVCLLAGVCSALLCLMRSPSRNPAGYLALATASTVGAVFVAFVHCLFFIASGH